MKPHSLERLIETLIDKRLRSLDHVCGNSLLNCLNTNELNVLQHLNSRAGLTMGRLADESGLALSTLTGITDKLVSRGLLERRRALGDRRIVQVGLSEEGRKAWARRMEARHAVCRNVLITPEFRRRGTIPQAAGKNRRRLIRNGVVSGYSDPHRAARQEPM